MIHSNIIIILKQSFVIQSNITKRFVDSSFSVLQDLPARIFVTVQVAVLEMCWHVPLLPVQPLHTTTLFAGACDYLCAHAIMHWWFGKAWAVAGPLTKVQNPWRNSHVHVARYMYGH